MKQLKLVTVMALVALFGVSQLGHAAAGKGGSDKHVFYLGTALDQVYTGSPSVPGVTALITMGERTAMQVYLGLATVHPVNLGGGANVKFSLVGNNTKGFHIGGGLALGVMGGSVALAAAGLPAGQTFFINFNPGMGLHFEIVDNVIVSLDAALSVQIQTATTTADLRFGGNSNLLGASVVVGL